MAAANGTLANGATDVNVFSNMEDLIDANYNNNNIKAQSANWKRSKIMSLK